MRPMEWKMRSWSTRGRLVAVGIGACGLIGAGLVSAQTASQDKPLMADQVFKNVRVLKGIPVDDFMETMGS
jgi:hypothetical protein